MSLPESFKVYKKKITVDIEGREETFELLPLSGSYYAKFISLFKKSEYEFDPNLSDEENAKKAGTKFFKDLTEQDLETYHQLLLQTFIDSYDAKGSDIKDLDRFVSKNLLILINILPEVNLPNKLMN